MQAIVPGADVVSLETGHAPQLPSAGVSNANVDAAWVLKFQANWIPNIAHGFLCPTRENFHERSFIGFGCYGGAFSCCTGPRAPFLRHV
jgi:hypothetical protein